MKFRRLFAYVVFLLSVLTDLISHSFAQSYGLGFSGHEVVQDKRTGMDLSPGKSLCFKKDFEISFDMGFIPGKENYFGYIMRLIENDRQNIDILYDRKSTDGRHFKVIIGERFSDIAFNIPSDLLFQSWSRFRLKVSYSRSRLELFVGSKGYMQTMEAVSGGCYKVLFGANYYGDFKTTDVPPMRIRNIRITESGKLSYKWPLDEANGIVIHEEIKGTDASVINPIWIKKLHHNWQMLQSFTVRGAASIAFNKDSENVYIVGSDSLISYSVSNSSVRKLHYLSGRQQLRPGNQSLYVRELQKLYNIYIDQKLVSAYDFTTQRWDKQHAISPITLNWHFNKFYSAKDSSVYMIGGYGQFLYTNAIRKYHIPSGRWDSIIAKGDRLVPRYLAGVGATTNGAYILGGYGSSTGQQMLNPRNLYDFLYYDIKKRSFRKIYELKITGEDFVFANSLLINEPAGKFYALIFPKHKYNSGLRLIEGSLSKPEFRFLGDKIPYLFHDIYSFADLYYSHFSRRLIAVTLLRDETDETKVNIYSLNSPPLESKEEYISEGELRWRYFTGGILIAGLLVLFIVRKKKRGGLQRLYQSSALHTEAVQQDHNRVLSEDRDDEIVEEPVAVKNSIFLFGNFQVFDSEGNDLTKHFSPLIKELFLVLLLYTISKGRGISSEKLYELLWFDKSADSARNNRSVNIAKLKSIIDKMSGCKVSKETGYWKVDIDYEHIWVDYTAYINIVRDKKKLSKNRVTDLAYITKRGGFLSDLDYSWLDEFKSEISNDVIDTYLHFAESVNISDDPEFLIQLANYIFYFDPVNEEAMTLKCKALAFLGKHSLAKSSFENFAKEYRQIYGEDFTIDFNEVLNK